MDHGGDVGEVSSSVGFSRDVEVVVGVLGVLGDEEGEEGEDAEEGGTREIEMSARVVCLVSAHFALLRPKAERNSLLSSGLRVANS